MTNDERRDFEQHKKQAEKQMQDMYYGNRGRNQNQNGLKMPPFLSQSPSKKEPAEQSAPKNQTEEKPKAGPVYSAPSNRGNLLQLINFKNITMDNDRLIILSLCLLLSAEQADELLLLALIYIML